MHEAQNPDYYEKVRQIEAFISETADAPKVPQEPDYVRELSKDLHDIVVENRNLQVGQPGLLRDQVQQVYLVPMPA